MQIEYSGNKHLLNQHKTAFLCSRTVSSKAVMRCYDWAMEVDVEHTAIVSGFQSKIEKDILHLLGRRKAKIILVLARRMYKTLPEEFQPFMKEGHLLLISISSASRTAKEAACKRNEYIVQLSDEVVFGYVGQGSSLETIVTGNNKKTTILCQD